MSHTGQAYSLSNTSPTTRPSSTFQAVEELLSRKRKRQEEGERLRFTIRPSANASQPTAGNDIAQNTPQAFRSLLLISRSQLPLSFLDSALTPTRLFSSHLPSLEDQSDAPSHGGPKVLIARRDDDLDARLHAVERVDTDVYVLCALSSWVEPRHIESLGSGSAGSAGISPAVLATANEGSGAGPWWRACTVASPEMGPASSLQPRKAPRLSMCRPQLHQQNRADTQIPSPATRARGVPDPAVGRNGAEPSGIMPPGDGDMEPENAATSAEDVFLRFVGQYLETLYLSRTPLAFFAKGPVARARAAFAAGQVESSTPADHVLFLRALIHSSSSADKKYKDKLPDMLKKVAARALEHDDATANKEKKKKSRKKPKLKPDKHGIFQDEERYFEQWWRADETSFPADETADQSFKRMAAQLRTRETFMQLILVLEVLSLDSPQAKDTQSQLPTLPADNESQADPPAKSTKSTSRKRDDLLLTLELLLDKLSIWHSLDAALVSDDPSTTSKDKSSSNDLRNFCTEVVIPFYLSRCPDHALNVNKKLGGPSTTTSSSSTTTKSRLGLRKPGDADLRQRPDRKPRRPLHRVATETAHASTHQAHPPSLRHTGSDSLLLANHVKREGSETPSLSQIPSFRAQRDSETPLPQPARRGSGIQHLKAREVDFSALAAAQEAKARKKREVDEKLKDAILGLKRPDRVRAGREIADVAEQRRLIAAGRGRVIHGPASTARRSKDASGAQERRVTAAGDTVHVAATPSHGRTQHMVKATPHRIAPPSFVSSQPLPSSGPTCIPSSSMRPPMLPLATYDQGGFEYQEVEEDTLVPATGRRQRTVRYEITPSKNRRVMSPLREEPGNYSEDDSGDEGEVDERVRELQTPSKPRRNLDFGTPSKSSVPKSGAGDAKNTAAVKRRLVLAPAAIKPPALIPATPAKEVVLASPQDQGLREAVGGPAAAASTSAVEGDGKSLYDALGWNDDFLD